MTSRLEQPRIIDKRRTFAGAEYLDSITGEWIPSSTSRCINPELVELYEWLHNSGYRDGATVFASPLRSNLGWAKGARKRLQPALPGATSPPQSPRDTSSNGVPERDGPSSRMDNTSGDNIASGGEDANIQTNESSLQARTEPRDDSIGAANLPLSPKSKKPRLEELEVEDLNQLSIAQPEVESPLRPPLSTTSAGHALKNEPAVNQTPEQEQEVRDFNRNTEHMIEIYFKEGMDASGVEMFDILLGPFRRPTKEFVASFFYAVILSPFTEPATIEAAIHVLDRTLTIHGPEPFQDIWDVQKRRREVADGTSAFSRQPIMSSSSHSVQSPGFEPMSGMSTRSSSSGNGENSANFNRASMASNPTGRLPSWNNVWDLVKAELGLDNRPESKQHIALQENHIRIRLQGDGVHQDPSLAKEDDDSDEEASKEVERVAAPTEEQEIRDEIGRAIVGLMIRILEQDAVLKNVSIRTFFCRDVLTIDPFSPAQSIRQALDVAFQITALATTSRYLEPPSNTMLGGNAAIGSTGTAKSIAPWPLNERCTLNSAGMEILQLGQQFLLLLIRFTEAGQLLPGKGLEELAREVLSRLTKMNKDRKVPSSAGLKGSKRSGSATTYLLERYNLDQMEIFLKALIQGPCLLDSGTGSGAGVKLRKEGRARSRGTNEDGYSFGEDDYNGVLKSQTGVCMGSSAFVMILVDLWFRSKTTATGGGGIIGSANSQLSFRRVVEEYAMPNVVRPSGNSATTKSAKAKTAAAKKSLVDQDNMGQWNPKDLEQVEWTVMMLEVLIWSWIEARGIRREEIVGTGLEHALYPDESSWQCTDEDGSSGWRAMSELLTKLGGSLKSRWEQLESVIEAAIMVEDLGLR
ncbi:hypothetical protein BGX27_005631 [Mortierella sp. AM989]|nr:hypothetical protein BGX27_005631 [Mortierella sp. AM989]